MLARGALRPRTVSRCAYQSIIRRRSFSGSSIRPQNASTPSEDGRTTHFGFETVAESEKQGRGEIDRDKRVCSSR